MEENHRLDQRLDNLMLNFIKVSGGLKIWLSLLPLPLYLFLHLRLFFFGEGLVVARSSDLWDEAAESSFIVRRKSLNAESIHYNNGCSIA